MGYTCNIRYYSTVCCISCELFDCNSLWNMQTLLIYYKCFYYKRLSKALVVIPQLHTSVVDHCGYTYMYTHVYI